MPVPHRGVAQATPRRAQSEEQRQKPPLRAFRSPAGCSVHRRGRKWPVSRLAGRGIRPIPRGALPRAYATGYAGFGVHVRVPVPHLCSSEQRAAGGRWLTCRRWAAPRRCLGQISRRALGGRSAGTRRATVRQLTMSEATAINRRRDSSASKPVDASSRRRFLGPRNAAIGLAYTYL
jgi:hypothetical protein